jgi:hypothetical protein
MLMSLAALMIILAGGALGGVLSSIALWSLSALLGRAMAQAEAGEEPWYRVRSLPKR